jgi:hypothetical protein
MKPEEQRPATEVTTLIALLKVVRQLQLECGLTIREASDLVVAVLPKCGRLLEVWGTPRPKPGA